MPMLGSGNRDCIHVFLFEYRAKVFLRHRGLAHFLLRAVGELFENIAVYIADMRDAGGAPVRLERREMSVGATIQANHGKVEAVIRSKDLTVALCRRSYCNGGRSHCEGIKKLTSCNHRFSSWGVSCRTAIPGLKPADKTNFAH